VKIQRHKIVDASASFQKSPNHGDKFAENTLDTIVIHYTAGSSAESSVRTLCDPKTRASAHLVIGRDASITQLVPFDTIAWHAGRSSYEGRVGFNRYSIGIEIDNAGRLTRSGDGYQAWFGRKYDRDEVVEAVHRNESTASYWQAFSETQITLVHEICALLIKRYGIQSILGHEEIAPGRKTDPGPAFPLDKLRDHLLHSDRSQEDEDEAVVATQETGFVTASSLNLRSAASPDSPVVAAPLARGTAVEILDERNGWYEVDVRTRGWVKKDYIDTAT
jgi:N-acetylmuramoyl-L-alanine amidase